MLKKTIIGLVLGAILFGTFTISTTGYAASKKSVHSSKENIVETVLDPEVTTPTTQLTETPAISENQVTMKLVTELYDQFADKEYGVQADHLRTDVGLQNAFEAVSINTTNISFKIDLNTIGVLGNQALEVIQLHDLVNNTVITPASISSDGVVTFDTTNQLQASDQGSTTNNFYRYQVELNFTGDQEQALSMFKFAVYA